MKLLMRSITGILIPLICTPYLAAQGAAESESELIVTGTRLNQSILDVSSSVTLITSEEVEAIQADDIGDLLDYVPGVDVVADSRYGIKSINIRGLEGNYVKVKLDNVDVPADFDNSDLISSSRIDMDIDMIRSVEVIRGPASTSQGSGAIGGVVMFQTKRASDFVESGERFGGHVKTQHSSASNNNRVSLAFAHKEGSWANLIGYTTSESAEVNDYSEQTPEEVTRQNLLLKSGYRFNNYHSLEFSLDYSETETVADPTNPTESTSYDLRYDTEDLSERLRYGLTYKGQLDSALADQFAVQLDWQGKDSNAKTFRHTSNYFGSGPRSEIKDYLYAEEGYTLDLQINKAGDIAGFEADVAYGLTYKDSSHENINTTLIDDNFDGEFGDSTQIFYYMPYAESQALGLYLHTELALLDGKLKLSPGLRYDSFEQTPYNTDPSSDPDYYTGWSATNSYEDFSDSEATFRLGAVYDLSDELKLFSQYSQGFKAPDFRQLYYSFSNDTRRYKFEPNAELESEYSDSFEIGLRRHAAWGGVEASIFETRFENFISEEIDTSDPAYSSGITRHVNIEEATISGVELSSNFDTSSFLEGSWANLAFSHTEGEDGDGNALQDIAPWSASLAWSFDSSNDWGTTLRLKYHDAVSEGDFEDQFAAGASSVVDLVAYYQPVDALTLRLGIYNLTDEKYYRWASIRGVSATADTDEFAEAKRSKTLSLKYDF